MAWKHKREAVESVLRGVELVAVFVAMAWTLLWAATRARREAPHRHLALDFDDRDGGASMERSRRRRHID